MDKINSTKTQNTVTMEYIAKIYTDFPTKFGIPRQSGLVNELTSKIVFEPKYRLPEAIKGLSGYSHIWLIWYFSQSDRAGWLPSVRPPRLGGNKKMGVFATRSPIRPNPLGLSCVQIVDIREEENLGNVIYVKGADMLNATPIFDIKPYLPITDIRQDAVGGFCDEMKDKSLNVDFAANLMNLIDSDKRSALIKILQSDPRPAYIDKPDRIFGFYFADYEIKFQVDDTTLTVTEVNKI